MLTHTAFYCINVFLNHQMDPENFMSAYFLSDDGPQVNIDNFDLAFPPALAFTSDIAGHHLLGDLEVDNPVYLHHEYEQALESFDNLNAPTQYTLPVRPIESQPKILYLEPINLNMNGADIPLRCLFRAGNGLIISMDAELSNLNLVIENADIQDYRETFQTGSIGDALLGSRGLTKFRNIIRKMIALFVKQHAQLLELVVTVTGEMVGYNQGEDRVNSLSSVYHVQNVRATQWRIDSMSTIDEIIEAILSLFMDRVDSDQIQAGSDEILAEVHSIILREMRVFLRAKNGHELNLEAPVKKRQTRVKNPLNVMRGACGRDFIPSEQSCYFWKHLVPLDDIHSNMNLARWNCGLRCLLYAKADSTLRIFYEKNPQILAWEAIKHRQKLLGILNGEGPIHVDEMLTIATDMKLNILIKIWQVGEGFVETVANDPLLLEQPANADAFLALFKGHYVMAKNFYHWDLLSTAYKCCKKCAKVRDAYSHDTEASPCKGRKNKRQYSEMGDYHDPDDEKSRFKSIIPMSNKRTVTCKSKLMVCDFETWRKPSRNADGQVQHHHQVYASALQIGLKDMNFEEMVVFYGPNALLQTCEKLRDVATTTTPKEPYFLYFYNGSGFDHIFLLDCFIKDLGIMPDNVVLKDGRIMAASFFGETLHLRDLYLFTRCSLSMACKSFGVPDEYAKGDFDHEKMKTEIDLELHREECIEYLRNDITATAICLVKFWDASKATFDMDFCPTLTSSHMAFDCWRKTLGCSQLRQIKLPRTSAEDAEMRRAYYGGRVFPGLKAFICKDFGPFDWTAIIRKQYGELTDYLVDLDVASLYPAAMAGSKHVSQYETIMPYFTGEFYTCNQTVNFDTCRLIQIALIDFQDSMDATFKPVMGNYIDYLRNVYTEVGIDLHRLYRNDQGYRFWREDLFPFMKKGAIVTVDLTCPKQLSMPILPAKDKTGNIQWDLTDKTHQAYSIDELLEAIVLGYRVTRVHQAIVFEKRLHLFQKHISTNYELKKKAKRGEAQRDISKNNMNHTYGKFGQEIIKTNVSYHTHHQVNQELNNDEWLMQLVSLQPIIHNASLARHVKIPPTLYEAFSSVVENQDTMTRMLDDMEVQEVLAFKVERVSEDLAPTKPVYIALQTTANSHMIMNRYLLGLCLIHQIPFAYTDTDSLVVHRRAVENMNVIFPNVIGKELGQLDDELEGGRVWAQFAIAPKFYCLAYMMPDGKSYLKVRTKGFPHPKHAIPITDTYLEDAEAGALPYLCYAENDMVDPEDPEQYLTCPSPYFNMDANLPLKTMIYSVTYRDGQRRYMTHLTHQVFYDMIKRDVVKLRVFFSSMKRRMHNDHGVNVGGIEHVQLSRSLNPDAWWGNSDPVRHSAPDDIFGDTFPRGYVPFQPLQSLDFFGQDVSQS